MLGGNELTALSDLLGSSAQVHDEHEQSNHMMTPASMLSGHVNDSDLMDKPIGKIKIEDPKAIWSSAEVPEEGEDEDYADTRKRPRFDILYKQDVMTEDVFLGLGEKDPSSAHCSHLSIRIHFPGHKMKDLEVDVTKQKIVAESSTHKLSTYLPHPVFHDKGKAKWDSSSEHLILHLPIIRDEW